MGLPKSKKNRDTLIRIASFASGLLVYLFISRVVLSHLDNGPLRIFLSMIISFAIFTLVTLTIMAIINRRKNKK